MKRRVIITKLPQAGSGLDVKMQGLKAGLGFNANTMPWAVMAGQMSAPDVEVNSTLKPVPRSKANVEAEKGEVASVPGEGGIPSTFKIAGERHHSGGTPLNLPKDSFIFSDTNAMKIKDPEILAQFGITTTSNMTPAGIAKKYDVNKWKGILADPDTDDIQRKTAEMMISNYNLKLAKLGLVQESKKGFPQGIPQVAMPYIESMQINPDDMVDMNPGSGGTSGMMDNMAEYGGFLQKGGIPSFGTFDISQPTKTGSEKQARFASNYETKDVFQAYHNALKSGTIDNMLNTANTLDAYDVPNSLGFLPWTDQDKVDDLATLLREKALKIGQGNKRVEDYGKKAKQVYETAVYKMNKYPEGSVERIHAKGLVDQLASLHPTYKANHPYMPAELTGTIPVKYSDADITNINTLYNQYPETLTDLIKKDKQQTVKPIPKLEDVGKVTDAELKLLIAHAKQTGSHFIANGKTY